MTISPALPIDSILNVHTVVKGVAFRRQLVEASMEMQLQQQEQQQQQQQEVTASSHSTATTATSSSEITNAIRADAEMAHPNWAQDEMMRTKACSWIDSRLLPSVWAPPPRHPPVPLVASSPTTIGVIPQLPTSFPCPFGLQYQDVIAVQHRSH
jgi:hypothetical protein